MSYKYSVIFNSMKIIYGNKISIICDLQGIDKIINTNFELFIIK